jgi:hypothetical protein
VDKERYPDIHEIITAAQMEGLRYLKQVILFENEAIELGADYLELVRKKGYSMLHLIPEHEYAAGLRNLEYAMKNGSVRAMAAGETLLWFTKE